MPSKCHLSLKLPFCFWKFPFENFRKDIIHAKEVQNLFSGAENVPRDIQSEGRNSVTLSFAELNSHPILLQR